MKAVALCSMPRLVFSDFLGNSVAAFFQNGIPLSNVYGCFWGQALTKGIEQVLDNDPEYVIVTDYDSVFDAETVHQLMRLADHNPHADAISCIQMGRFSGVLLSTDSGEITFDDLRNNDLVQVRTANFGLTIFRSEALRSLAKPLFLGLPNEDGDWKEGKLDEDTYFWRNFEKCGKKLYVAPRLVIGHMELMISWPSGTMDKIVQTTADFTKYGAPGDVWK